MKYIKVKIHPATSNQQPEMTQDSLQCKGEDTLSDYLPKSHQRPKSWFIIQKTGDLSWNLLGPIVIG